ncbi:MAG TPA: alpha/beta fold hydrolase [Dyella sp.]|uniref:alpha/beta hydrolase family protein n=1 Tax=Dyella sp. TaxID=1869338 RepID=UPI002D78DD43|nr:alpha/beta fold hydrolase [Dyella sp.]HET6555063.1 alpha/beta fold hydrolase [Dyella sp.]
MSLPLSPALPESPYKTCPVVAADGARTELLLQLPEKAVATNVIYWLPALGVSARQYLPLAQSLASQGVAMVIHEWRGIGSSDRRAGRDENWGYRELLEDDIPAGLAAARQQLPQARIVLGGHSLGAQMAALYASLHPRDLQGLVMVASGAPYWRQFPQGRLLWLAYVLAPWLSRLFGHLPGRKIGFGGNEARQLIDDWARTGRTGRYAALGMTDDFEHRLSELTLPVLALRLADDWLGPQASLSWLLGKLSRSKATVQVVTSGDLDGKVADHFGWMKAPAPIAQRVSDWLSSGSMA